jgi:hypothetical protein
MNILLCKRGLDRLDGAGKSLLAALRDEEHSPVVKDCLDRCQGCDKGLLIATADGMPLSAFTAEKLLANIADLAAED